MRALLRETMDSPTLLETEIDCRRTGFVGPELIYWRGQVFIYRGIESGCGIYTTPKFLAFVNWEDQLPNRVEEFQGKYRFLSNFPDFVVMLEGKQFRCPEGAYQWWKLDSAYRDAFYDLFRNADGYAAKKLSKTLKSSWAKDYIHRRTEAMTIIERDKYSREPARSLLLSTNDMELIEGNNWHDTFFGVCIGEKCRYAPHPPEGTNLLGKILMKIRKELQDADADASASPSPEINSQGSVI